MRWESQRRCVWWSPEGMSRTKSQGGEPSLGRLQEWAKDSLAWLSLINQTLWNQSDLMVSQEHGWCPCWQWLGEPVPLGENPIYCWGFCRPTRCEISPLTQTSAKHPELSHRAGALGVSSSTSWISWVRKRVCLQTNSSAPFTLLDANQSGQVSHCHDVHWLL